MSFDLHGHGARGRARSPTREPLERRTRRASSSTDVGFGYAGGPTCSRTSPSVPAGEAVAIVGPTGAGKSTLVEPAAAVLRPERGQRCGSTATTSATASSTTLRSQFSIVLQEPLLFSGTIANNIRYGKPDALDGGGRSRRRRPRTPTTSSRRCPNGYETRARRARHEDLGRRAPADRRGARVPPRRPDPDPRRADVVDRLPHRVGDPRGARPADGGPDDDPDRPPPLDPPQRRRDPRDGRGRDRPARDPRGARGQAGLYRQLWDAQTRAQATAARRQPRGRRTRRRRRSRRRPAVASARAGAAERRRRKRQLRATGAPRSRRCCSADRARRASGGRRCRRRRCRGRRSSCSGC